MDGTPTTLVRFEAMKQAIEQCRTIDEVKDIRDKAEALRMYTKQAGESLEVQNSVAEIKLRAERKAGELLREMGKSVGGRPLETSNIVLPVFTPPTLADIGISKMQSSRWQQIAALPQETFDNHILETTTARKELTTAGVLREAQRQQREERSAVLDVQPLPVGKYRVFYVDPPWHYNDSGVIGDTDNYGRAERHYPTMTIDELCDLGIRIEEMTLDNAVLFMWATSPLFEDAFSVIRAWGFQYKTSFVWDKVKHNYGHYNSVRHELLLICTKGSCLPDSSTLLDSVVTVERSEQHSEKPEEFRKIIDDLYPHGPRIELFARKNIEGWASWGNELTD